MKILTPAQIDAMTAHERAHGLPKCLDMDAHVALRSLSAYLEALRALSREVARYRIGMGDINCMPDEPMEDALRDTEERVAP